MDKTEAAKLVAVALAACPQQAVRIDGKRSAAMIDTWAALLGDITYEAANAAMTVLLQTSPFLPSVAEIRSTALELAKGPTKTGGEAWGEVMKLRTYRELAAMDAVDPRVMQVCKAMDWVKRRTLWRNGQDVEQWAVQLGDNESADRARFIEMFDKLASQDRRESVAPRLAAAREERSRQIEAAGNAFQRVLTAAKAGGS